MGNGYKGYNKMEVEKIVCETIEVMECCLFFMLLIYSGENTEMDTIQYLNVEDYLKSL